jgi:hypothetical protein|tara:strand:- start:421 stop:1029 length:609 start_codon:yes stop_codon:yes gene_type:complete
MALISWKQISPDLLSYGRLTGSLEVSGSIVSEGHIVPSTGAEFDLGSADKPFRDLYLHTASLKFVREGAVISTIVGDADGIKIGNIRITTSSIDIVNNAGSVISTVAQASSSAGDVVGTKVDPAIFSKTGSFSSATTDIQVTGSLSIRLNGSSDTFKVNINGEDKLEVNTEGTVIYKPIATAPTYVSGGLFFSASGDFYLGG